MRDQAAVQNLAYHIRWQRLDIGISGGLCFEQGHLVNRFS
jgi:hypothetical protein